MEMRNSKLDTTRKIHKKNNYENKPLGFSIGFSKMQYIASLTKIKYISCYKAGEKRPQTKSPAKTSPTYVTLRDSSSSQDWYDSCYKQLIYSNEYINQNRRRKNFENVLDSFIH